jgi:UDP-glucuronate decarboxylase
LKLLLTGGTGFFGRALLRHWQAQSGASSAPTEVVVLSRAPGEFLDRFPEFRGQEWLHFHRGDILQPETLPRGKRFTHVLHAAADSSLGHGLARMERHNQIVDGTRHLLDYAANNNIARFLLASSGGVYGPQPQDMLRIHEEYNQMPDPLDPANVYSVAKRYAEHLCALYRDKYGMETVIARCFAFVGRDLPLDAHFAVGNFIRDAVRSEAIQVKGDGSPIRSYMDQRDLAEWLLALLARGKAGHAYNVGSDQEISIRDLAHLVRDLLAPAKAVKIAGSQRDGNFRNRYVPSIDKAAQGLSLRLNHTLPESLIAAADHARGRHCA